MRQTQSQAMASTVDLDKCLVAFREGLQPHLNHEISSALVLPGLSSTDQEPVS